jgi:CBS domain-containing protein
MTEVALHRYRASEFMTRDVATVREDDAGRTAVDLMVRRQIGSVVVLGRSGPAGVLTERDLVSWLARGEDPARTPVAEMMDAAVTRIGPDTGSEDAARMMTDSRGRLIVFEGGEMKGIVTASDLVKVVWRLGVQLQIRDVVSKSLVSIATWMPIVAAIKEMQESRVGSIVLEAEGVPKGIFTERDTMNRVVYPGIPLDRPVSSVGTFPIMCARAGIDGREAANAMVTMKIKRLPLSDGDDIVGMVTARDIVEAYAYPGAKSSEFEGQMSAKHGEVCPICSTRIDQRGLCACGTQGGD